MRGTEKEEEKRKGAKQEEKATTTIATDCNSNSQNRASSQQQHCKEGAGIPPAHAWTVLINPRLGVCSVRTIRHPSRNTIYRLTACLPACLPELADAGGCLEILNAANQGEEIVGL